ncbi:MAG: hypothetical protein IJI67_03700 [Clostridia bacterium]|nr:hypothetical protein [Clostridia bacterium]
MKEFIQKIGKKKLIIIGAVALAVIAAAVVLVIVFSNRGLKTVENVVDQNYLKVAEKTDAAVGDFDKALGEFEKSESADETIYTKGDETVKIKTDANGKVIYLSYNKELSDDVQVKIGKFNESMIKIGDSREAVLKSFANQDYTYYLKTTNKEGKDLQIYYYGWTGTEAAVEFVFTDGKLTYYTINSDDYAAKSDAPDVEDIS